MKVHRYTEKHAKRDLPKRRADSHKTEAGKTLIMGGSQGMWGAAILAAEAASRSGSGYVYLCSPSKRIPIGEHPQFLTIKNLRKLNFYLFNSIALGPGMTNTKFLDDWIHKLADSGFKHVVLDAGALRTLAQIKESIHLPPTWILTPHEGELAAMLDVPAREIHKHRHQYLQFAQEIWGCIILLKGHKTLVMDSESLWEIQSGNAALAKAGTGDVLTGYIAGLLAQGMSARRAACLAAFIHGYESDNWLRRGNDILSLMPNDLIQDLPHTLSEIRNYREITST